MSTIVFVVSVAAAGVFLQQIPESWNLDLGGFVLGSLILYLKGRRRMMFQLSGFYYSWLGVSGIVALEVEASVQ